jgi:tetratricopeptide (TPR) repeat protein
MIKKYLIGAALISSFMLSSCGTNKENVYNTSMGEYLAGKGKYTTSLKYYERAKEHDNTVAKTYSSKGYSLIALGRYTKAVKEFNTALSYDDYSAEAYYGRGFAKYKLNQKAAAKEDLLIARKIAYQCRNKALYKKANILLGSYTAENKAN